MAEGQPECLLLAFAEERLSPSFSLSLSERDKTNPNYLSKNKELRHGEAEQFQCSLLHSPGPVLQRRRCSRAKPCYHSTVFSSLDKPRCAYIKGKQTRPLALVVLFHLSEHASFPGARHWCDSTQGHGGTKRGLYQPNRSSASRPQTVWAAWPLGAQPHADACPAWRRYRRYCYHRAPLISVQGKGRLALHHG